MNHPGKLVPAWTFASLCLIWAAISSANFVGAGNEPPVDGVRVINNFYAPYPHNISDYPTFIKTAQEAILQALPQFLASKPVANEIKLPGQLAPRKLQKRSLNPSSSFLHPTKRPMYYPRPGRKPGKNHLIVRKQHHIISQPELRRRMHKRIGADFAFNVCDFLACPDGKNPFVLKPPRPGKPPVEICVVYECPDGVWPFYTLPDKPEAPTKVCEVLFCADNETPLVPNPPAPTKLYTCDVDCCPSRKRKSLKKARQTEDENSRYYCEIDCCYDGLSTFILEPADPNAKPAEACDVFQCPDGHSPFVLKPRTTTTTTTPEPTTTPEEPTTPPEEPTMPPTPQIIITDEPIEEPADTGKIDNDPAVAAFNAILSNLPSLFSQKPVVVSEMPLLSLAMKPDAASKDARPPINGMFVVNNLWCMFFTKPYTPCARNDINP